MYHIELKSMQNKSVLFYGKSAHCAKDILQLCSKAQFPQLPATHHLGEPADLQFADTQK